MYHIGKVVKIYRKREKDLGVQATIEMWDENVLTLEVDPRVSKEITVGSFILADYRPISGMTVPAAKQLVTRVLDDADATEVWALYKQQAERNKAVARLQTHGVESQYG